jgi:hypothetical protein
MNNTEKRSDVIADTLTIREMAAIIDGLTALSLSSYEFFSREDLWFLRRLINEAHSTAQRNEHAGDYDYPEDAA